MLVVEDEDDNRVLLERLLTEIGCATDSADNGRAALEKLASGTHPLVLMDIAVPRSASRARLTTMPKSNGKV